MLVALLLNVRINRLGDVQPLLESGRAELARLAVVLGVVGRALPPPALPLPRTPSDGVTGVFGECAKSRLLGSVRRMEGTCGM